MKKLIFILLLLVPLVSFAQAPWIYSSGKAITTVHAVVDSTVFPDLDADLGVMVYLKGYATGSTTGHGWFNVATASTTLDGVNIFDHPDVGKRYVRMVTITGAFTATGEVTFATTVSDTNAFTTTGETDTVTVSGAAITDKYIVTMRGSAVDAQDTVLIVEPTATGFVLHRPASGASGLKYTWLRLN